MQPLVIHLLSVGLDLDKGRVIVDQRCNYASDKVDITRLMLVDILRKSVEHDK